MDLIQVEQKANELVNKGMITEALEQFQIILKKKPNDLRIRKTMADLYVKIDDKGKARRYYLEVAELDALLLSEDVELLDEFELPEEVELLEELELLVELE